MSNIRIASTYAKSLLDIAQEQGKLEEVVGDVRLFLDAISNRDLLLMIKSPIISADKKRSVFKAVFEGKVDNVTLMFFDLIIKKSRESALPEMGEQFLAQYKSIKNITSVSVTSATSLDEEQMLKIKTEIVNLGWATGEIEIEEKVDPSIIGGFILEVEGKLYDASVKNKLANLKKGILDNTYIKSL